MQSRQQASGDMCPLSFRNPRPLQEEAVSATRHVGAPVNVSTNASASPGNASEICAGLPALTHSFGENVTAVGLGEWSTEGAGRYEVLLGVSSGDPELWAFDERRGRASWGARRWIAHQLAYGDMGCAAGGRSADGCGMRVEAVGERMGSRWAVARHMTVVERGPADLSRQASHAWVKWRACSGAGCG